MLDKQSCERRVYRLAVLLTGNPKAATRVISSVIGSKADIRKLDSAHLDRLIVLRSREIAPGIIRDDRLSQSLAKALSELSAQQRESWVFNHVYRMMPRDIAKAMDCSVRAVRTHLTTADAHMHSIIGNTSEEEKTAAKALLQYSMRMDVPEFYRKKVILKRSWSLFIKLFLILIILGTIAGGLYLLDKNGVFDPLIHPEGTNTDHQEKAGDSGVEGGE